MQATWGELNSRFGPWVRRFASTYYTRKWWKVKAFFSPPPSLISDIESRSSALIAQLLPSSSFPPLHSIMFVLHGRKKHRKLRSEGSNGTWIASRMFLLNISDFLACKPVTILIYDTLTPFFNPFLSRSFSSLFASCLQAGYYYLFAGKRQSTKI